MKAKIQFVGQSAPGRDRDTGTRPNGTTAIRNFVTSWVGSASAAHPPPPPPRVGPGRARRRRRRRRGPGPGRLGRAAGAAGRVRVGRAWSAHPVSFCQ